ncbi:hypothetical protein C2S52_022222 [Perilla frutescens var. hirtella]|nr:hypothetical protein C2S52_022222 [Perilla frutescens var. hirtella]
MKCILIQQHVFKAIDLSYPSGTTDTKKAEMNELAYSTLILNLSDSVIRKVVPSESGKTDSAKTLWDTLNQVYTEVSLSGRMFLLDRFINFKLDLSKDMDENLDMFNKLILDLKLSSDKHIDDYTSFVLLNSIHEEFNDVKFAIKYGRDDLSLDIVINALKGKEIDLKQGGNNSGQKAMKCYRCQETGHYAKECKNPYKPRENAKGSANNATEGNMGMFLG